MKKLFAWVLIGVFAATLGVAAKTQAEDLPGVSMGVFAEQRLENKFASEDLTFDYYGVRLQMRGESRFQLFADAGNQKLDLGGADVDDAAAVGIGGIFWLTRMDELTSFDIGLLASYHRAEHTFNNVSPGIDVDVTHSRAMGQAILRGDYGQVKPYLKAGVLYTELDPDSPIAGLPTDDLEETKPAIAVGLDIDLGESGGVLALEGNFLEGPGGGAYLQYWF